MLFNKNKQKKQQGKEAVKSTKGSSRKKSSSQQLSTHTTKALECVVGCGHDDHREHSLQHQQQEGNRGQPTTEPTSTIPAKLLPSTDGTKALKRVLEAGLMINGLKVLLVSAAEKIDLHVSHNAITPALLQELEDVAQAVMITTKKLNSIKSPCCDLYQTLPAIDDDDETGRDEEDVSV
jgi:hypothetical protein